MKNAREELLGLLRGKEIKCAKVTYDGDRDKNIKGRTVILKVGYNEEDYEKFLNDLNFEYHNRYSGQELRGTIWFKDNTWAVRCEYDGLEWWAVRSLPEIPKELQPEFEVIYSLF